MQSSLTISLNTLPSYLPLIEECNESRIDKLPKLGQILKNSQLALAHESREKSTIAADKKVIVRNAQDLICLVKGSKKNQSNNKKLNVFKDTLVTTDRKTANIVTVYDISEQVSQYLKKFDEHLNKLDLNYNCDVLGKLFVQDKQGFQQVREKIIALNATLIDEGEQWLKLLQDLISKNEGNNQAAQENRRVMQDKVLQVLNILPLKTQLIEALFFEVSTFKTQQVSLDVFKTRMVEFSNGLKQIYDSKNEHDFVNLESKKGEFLASYQKYVAETKTNRGKLEEILKDIPEIPTDAAIATHLNTIIMNDQAMELQTKKDAEDTLSKTIKVYENARKELNAAQVGIETHIEKLLKHRIDRLLNGIEWKDFRWSTWERSFINWTKYSEKIN
jgi:hypothetical protein